MIIELSNQECLTGSFNGPSLVQTLRSLSPAEAASTDTYEGYSAWSVALHVLYFKHMIAVKLGADVPDYEYEKADFPSPPDDTTQAEWDRLIAAIEATQKGFIDAVASATEDTLEAEHEAWKVPLSKSVTWVISHDTNHNAQIRNMGLASLRK